MVVCAAGPSLLKKLPMLKALAAIGIPICAVKGVASVLLEHGITPKYAVFLDSRPDQIRLLKTTSKEVIYCLASQVDPALYARLEGHDIRTFNASHISLHDDGDDYITGGSTTGLRAINLMRWAGYTSFHLFGFDCCLDGEQSHVYDKDNVSEPLRVRVGDRYFMSTPEMACQHQDFVTEYLAVQNPLNVVVYGDGTIAQAFKEFNAGRKSVWIETDDLPMGAVPLVGADQIADFMAGNDGQENFRSFDLPEAVQLAQDQAPIPLDDFYKGRRTVAVETTQIMAHFQSALARKWAEHPWVRPHGAEVVICGGGPSMKDRATLNKIRRMAERGAMVCTVNMTHDHFLDLPKRGLGPKIEPDFCVLLDPKEIVKTYVKPIRGPLYFIASQCDPKVLDVFEKPGITKFLYHHEIEAMKPHLSKDSHAVPPIFSTVGMDSILVLYRLGFRKFHLFGMEGSYRVKMVNGQPKPVDLHGYPKPMEYLSVVRVAARNTATGEQEEFLSNDHMACQAEDFHNFAQYWTANLKPGRFERITITVHGEGYLPAAAKILHNKYEWIEHADALRERLRRQHFQHGKGARQNGALPRAVRHGESHQLQ